MSIKDEGRPACSGIPAYTPILRQIAHQLVGSARVDVVDQDFLDTEVVVEGQRLEFALRAIANQGLDGVGELAGDHLHLNTRSP